MSRTHNKKNLSERLLPLLAVLLAVMPFFIGKADYLLFGSLPPEIARRTLYAPEESGSDVPEESSPAVPSVSSEAAPTEAPETADPVFPAENGTEATHAEPMEPVIPGDMEAEWPGVDYSFLPSPLSRDYPTAGEVMENGGLYLKNADQKVIYLTFCIGDDLGYTDAILDILKEKEVKAAFFLSMDLYVPVNTDKVWRMIEEQHLVGSHGYNHAESRSMSDIYFVNDAVMAQRGLDAALGCRYPLRYYRAPGGLMTLRDIYVACRMGITPVHFSFSYRDFDQNNMPDRDKALAALKTGIVNGAIYYLHASECNAEALGEFIDYAREQGYSFLRIDQNPGDPLTEPEISPLPDN